MYTATLAVEKRMKERLINVLEVIHSREKSVRVTICNCWENFKSY